jgi:DNA-binding response OmpR family regulator
MPVMPMTGIFLVDRFSRNEGLPLSDKEKSLQPQRSLPKILVVDDERRIADTLAEILQMSGFHVVISYDGWEALEAAARFRPDYLLTDVLMPRMNGVELAIAMRKMYPNTRILLFSGQAGISEMLLDGQRQGFEFELIAKPIHPIKLIERLKKQ